MLVKSLAGNLCMGMFFDLLGVWLFFQLLLARELNWHCLFFWLFYWQLLECCMLGMLLAQRYLLSYFWLLFSYYDFLNQYEHCLCMCVYDTINRFTILLSSHSFHINSFHY